MKTPRVLLSYFESCWVMLSQVESCRDLLKPVKSYGILLSPNESCWVLMSPVEPCCWALLSTFEYSSVNFLAYFKPSTSSWTSRFPASAKWSLGWQAFSLLPTLQFSEGIRSRRRGFFASTTASHSFVQKYWKCISVTLEDEKTFQSYSKTSEKKIEAIKGSWDFLG